MAEKRRNAERAEALGIATLAARGDKKAIDRQLKDLAK